MQRKTPATTTLRLLAVSALSALVAFGAVFALPRARAAGRIPAVTCMSVTPMNQSMAQAEDGAFKLSAAAENVQCGFIDFSSFSQLSVTTISVYTTSSSNVFVFACSRSLTSASVHCGVFDSGTNVTLHPGLGVWQNPIYAAEHAYVHLQLPAFATLRGINLN